MKKILRGVSAKKHTEPVINSAQAFSVSPSSVFQMRVALTARQLRAFPARFLSECTLFPDTIHRGGEVFFCAGMAQVLAAIEAERAEPQSAPTKKAA
jgi:hypothetical protein